MQLRHTVGIENGNKRQQTGKSLKKFKKIATFSNKQEQTATNGNFWIVNADIGNLRLWEGEFSFLFFCLWRAGLFFEVLYAFLIFAADLRMQQIGHEKKSDC